MARFLHDDLVDAQAAIDWAVAQLPVLRKRTIAWKQTGPYSVVVDNDAKPGYKGYRLTQTKPFDPLILAEAGAIIHSIRSSLDVLACTLAARNCHPEDRSTHFPIWKSAADFRNRKTRPFKYIERLSKIDQGLIEALRPYPGGKGDWLCTLHELDLTRKHRRLLRTSLRPRGWVTGSINESMLSDDHPLILFTRDTSSNSNVSVGAQITFNEADRLKGEDFIHAIREFASAATAIIKLFD